MMRLFCIDALSGTNKLSGTSWEAEDRLLKEKPPFPPCEGRRCASVTATDVINNISNMYKQRFMGCKDRNKVLM